MSKGGQQTSQVTLPPEITAQAKENMELAKQVGSLPYAPYFGGSVAAFQPAQMAGFNNMNNAASAFGLQGSAGQGLPQSQNFGGIQGYSTQGVYEDAMSRLPPGVLELYNSFFYPNNTAAVGREKDGGKDKDKEKTPAKSTERYPTPRDWRGIFN